MPLAKLGVGALSWAPEMQTQHQPCGPVRSLPCGAVLTKVLQNSAEKMKLKDKFILVHSTFGIQA